MSFGKRLKNALKYKKTTQKQLAELLDTTPQSISQYVVGKRNPSGKMVASIADALNLGYTYTKGGEAYFYIFIESGPLSNLKEYEKDIEFNEKQYKDALNDVTEDESSYKNLSESTGLPIEFIQGYAEAVQAPQIETLKKLSDDLEIPLPELTDILYFHRDELVDFIKSEYSSLATDELREAFKDKINYEPPLNFSELIKKEILSKLNLLNKQGQEKLYNYSCDLLKIREYRADTPPDQEETAPDEALSPSQKEPDKN